MSLPQVGRSIEHFIYAHAQAPWRAQRQWLGGVLVVVLGMAMVASLYLDVTSQAAIAGREIQDLTNQMIAVQQESADLQSKLAQVTSTSQMEQRAAALGYQPVDASQLQYVLVPGYKAPEAPMLAGAQPLRPSAARVPPEYTESLLSWLNHRLGGSISVSAGVNP
jgi:hypothetical protein